MNKHGKIEHMFVDAHCHLTGTYLSEDQVIPTLERAKDKGVTGFIAVGTTLEDSKSVLALTESGPSIRASLGVHPHEAKSWNKEVAGEIETLVQHPNVCFVGETGLDYHYNLSPRIVQQDVFREQIRLAIKINKPLMIHTREAREDTISILREECADKVKGIIHCFSEDLDFATEALDLGFYISFSGILTFKNADEIRAVGKWAPANRILVETDAPFLAPIPHRGKPNEPAFVRDTAEVLAELRGISLEKLASLTTENLENLCAWHPSSQ